MLMTFKYVDLSFTIVVHTSTATRSIRLFKTLIERSIQVDVSLVVTRGDTVDRCTGHRWSSLVFGGLHQENSVDVGGRNLWTLVDI